MEGTNSQPKAIEIRISVAQKVAEKSPGILAKVVDTLSDLEVGKREEMLVKALTARDEAEKKIRKIKPDQQAFDGEGKVVSETYSKVKKEELAKAKQELDKLDKAIEAAVSEKPDYKWLSEMYGKQQGGGGEGKQEEKSEKQE